MIKCAIMGNLLFAFLANPAMAMALAGQDPVDDLAVNPHATATAWVIDFERTSIVAEDAKVVCPMLGDYTDAEIAKVIEWQRVRGYTKDESLLAMLICGGYVEGRVSAGAFR